MSLVERLTDLDAMQRVHLDLDDGSSVEGRVHQFDYARNERLRLELLVEGEDARYQAVASFRRGSWTTVEVRRFVSVEYGPAHSVGEWTTLGAVTDVTPLEESAYPASDTRDRR